MKGRAGRTSGRIPGGVQVDPSGQRHHPGREGPSSVAGGDHRRQGQAATTGVAQEEEPIRRPALVEEGPVGGHPVLQRRREAVLRCQPVVDGDHGHPELIGDELGVELVGLEVAGDEGPTVEEEDGAPRRIARWTGQPSDPDAPDLLGVEPGVTGQGCPWSGAILARVAR